MVSNDIQGQIRIIVKRYDLHLSNEGLGVYIAPNGCLKKQLKETLKKIAAWNERIQPSFMLLAPLQFVEQLNIYYQQLYLMKNNADVSRLHSTR